MDDNRFRHDVASALEAIRGLLDRSVGLQEQIKAIEINLEGLGKESRQSTSELLQCASTDASLAEQRTGMAQERTALVREQTRLSTRASELAAIRTDLARERTSMGGQRTDLAVLRTDFSRGRTNLALQRTHMAGSRTLFSRKRTELAGARTHLALVRTGLAFLSLSIAFFRLFGFSWWSIFDGLLAVGSLVATIFGLSGYLRSLKSIHRIQEANSFERDLVT